ncbi:hypothetical protein PG985_014194 [Apiospora marii]|uniref:uncharacterized protein n=1 Tax=Apiospora marii TaxID=335849 RepID=UPI0031304F3B
MLARMLAPRMLARMLAPRMLARMLARKCVWPGRRRGRSTGSEPTNRWPFQVDGSWKKYMGGLGGVENGPDWGWSVPTPPWHPLSSSSSSRRGRPCRDAKGRPPLPPRGLFSNQLELRIGGQLDVLSPLVAMLASSIGEAAAEPNLDSLASPPVSVALQSDAAAFLPYWSEWNDSKQTPCSFIYWHWTKPSRP